MSNETCIGFTNTDLIYADQRWQIGAAIAGVIGLFAIVLSFFLIWQHWLNYTQPRIQKSITRILILVPVYTLTAFFSYYSLRSAVYLEVIQKCYESFVVYSFFNLMNEYLGETEEKRREALSNMERRRLPPPACFSFYDPSHVHFTKYCQAGVLQYVFFNSVLTFVALFAEFAGKYCSSSNSPHYAHVYVSSINAVSVGLAMFSLFTFYIPIHHILSLRKPNPILQFLSVKIVIFVTFWVSLVIKVFTYYRVIHGNGIWTQEEFSSMLQSFVIICEMGIATLIHQRAFTAEYFALEKTGTTDNFWIGVKDTFSFLDVVSDFKMLMAKRVERLAKRSASNIAPASREDDGSSDFLV